MKLKPGLLATMIVLLYLTIPLIGYALLGTMMTDKYQIEQERLFVEIKEEMTAKEKQEELQKIYHEEKELRLTQFTLIGLGVMFFSTATGLLLKRNKIIH